GQQVDVSAQESVNCIANSVNRWKREGTMSRRIGGYHGPMPGNTLEVGEVKYSHPKHRQIWECKDGHVAFLIHPGTRGAHNNRALAKYLEMDGGLPPILRNIDWETIDWGQTSPEQLAQIWDAFARFFARHTRRELYQIALKERIEFFPGNTVADVIKEEQLEARGFWQERKVPELMGKTLKFPGPFAQIRFSPVSVQKPETNLNKKQGQPARPFDGVKVLDFSWIYTGPMTTLWLAAYGAEVIKVESSSHLDTGRRGGGLGFVAWNSSKKSVTLNLKHPDGKKLARRLIKWADIVVENFAPGVMQRLGFGYDDLVKINPQIIMLSASMFGANGPHAAQRGLGQELTSLAAFNELTGWPDRTPVTAHGAYTDYVACRLTGATLFAVLHYRRRTGRGCYIDLSQFEASLHFLAPLILEYQATGKLLSRMGNRSLTDSPHGVFPCKGEDRWCAISVSSDSEWQAFCEALGRPDWTKDPRFDTFETRKQNENELENLISQWTTQLSAEEVMSCLQKAGVKAAVVANQADLFKDPQLSYRKHFVPVKHSQLGEYYHADSGFRLQQATPIVTMAPLFGEHNKSVATQLLGVSEDEFNNYLKAGALQ
ncbi:MAG: CoA transferase, partial [Chloroflexi bacterium]|nr:CoA transferase [Chloroflexota bacterium]